MLRVVRNGLVPAARVVRDRTVDREVDQEVDREVNRGVCDRGRSWLSAQVFSYAKTKGPVKLFMHSWFQGFV